VKANPSRMSGIFFYTLKHTPLPHRSVGEFNDHDPKDGELYRGRMKPTETLVKVLLRC